MMRSGRHRSRVRRTASVSRSESDHRHDENATGDDAQDDALRRAYEQGRIDAATDSHESDGRHERAHHGRYAHRHTEHRHTEHHHYPAPVAGSYAAHVQYVAPLAHHCAPPLHILHPLTHSHCSHDPHHHVVSYPQASSLNYAHRVAFSPSPRYSCTAGVHPPPLCPLPLAEPMCPVPSLYLPP